MRLAFAERIRLGPLLAVQMGLIFILSVIFLFYAISLMMMQPSILTVIVLFVLLLPQIVLHIVLFPVIRGVLSPQVKLYSEGIQVRRDMLMWKDIKSISFRTGRPLSVSFFRGFGLPMVQKIYVLDKEGREFEALLDVDYAFKSHRDKNNLRQFQEMLFALNQEHLISDWAQKH